MLCLHGEQSWYKRSSSFSDLTLLVPLGLIAKRNFVTCLPPFTSFVRSSLSSFITPWGLTGHGTRQSEPDIPLRGLEHVCFGVILGLIGIQRETTWGGGGRAVIDTSLKATCRQSLSREVQLQRQNGQVGPRDEGNLGSRPWLSRVLFGQSQKFLVSLLKRELPTCVQSWWAEDEREREKRKSAWIRSGGGEELRVYCSKTRAILWFCEAVLFKSNYLK